MTADAFPPIAFDTPTDTGRMSGKINLTGMNIDSAYDPAQPVPFTSRSMIGDVLADLRILQAGKAIPFRIEESGVQIDMKQTTADVGGRQRAAGFREQQRRLLVVGQRRASALQVALQRA